MEILHMWLHRPELSESKVEELDNASHNCIFMISW